MRSILLVISIALLSFAAIGCGATRVQRRTTAAITIAAGASLAVAGLVAANSQHDDCPPDVSGDGQVCIDLVDEQAIMGRFLVLAGGALATGGLIGLVAAERPEAPTPPPGADAAACIEWRRELDAESDPARRGAINAIRPAHCARPAVAAARSSAQ